MRIVYMIFFFLYSTKYDKVNRVVCIIFSMFLLQQKKKRRRKRKSVIQKKKNPFYCYSFCFSSNIIVPFFEGWGYGSSSSSSSSSSRKNQLMKIRTYVHTRYARDSAPNAKNGMRGAVGRETERAVGGGRSVARACVRACALSHTLRYACAYQ